MPPQPRTSPDVCPTTPVVPAAEAVGPVPLGSPLDEVAEALLNQGDGEAIAGRDALSPYLTFDDFRARYREPNAGVQLRLVERIQQGDEIALESVLISLAPFISMLATRRRNPMSLDERKATGVRGAADALSRYDPQQGSLTTFLSSRIIGAIIDEERDHVRGNGLSRSDYELVCATLEAVKQIEDPDQQRRALSDALHEFVKAGFVYVPHLVADRRVVSTHDSWQHAFRPAGDNDDGSELIREPAADYDLHETVEHRLATREQLQKLVDAIAGLSEREQVIARHSMFPQLFGSEQLTIQELGNMFSVHESRISQIRGAIVRKLTAACAAE